jgi:Ger(x)C family germination protein
VAALAGASVILSGCWDAKVLAETVFPLAIGFDVHTPGEENESEASARHARYDATVVFPHLAEIREGTEDAVPADDRSAFRVNTVRVDSSAEIRNALGAQLDYPYLSGQLQTIVFHQDVAAQGLNPLLETYARDVNVSGAVQLAVSESSSREVFQTKVSGHNPAIYLTEMLNYAPQKLWIRPTNLFEFSVQQGRGKNPVLPLITASKDGQIVLSGMAVFDKDRMIGKLDLDQSRILLFLRGAKAQGYMPFQVTEGEKTDLEGSLWMKNRRRVQISLGPEGIQAEITLRLSGRVAELITPGGSYRALDQEVYRSIETAVARQVQAQCEAFLSRMQHEWGVDCIDVSRYIAIQDRNHTLGDLDAGLIRQAAVTVRVEVDLTEHGEIR